MNLDDLIALHQIAQASQTMTSALLQRCAAYINQAQQAHAAQIAKAATPVSDSTPPAA